MLLTITTTAEPASDLGFLLHKHPGRVQAFDVSAGVAHVFYPEAGGRPDDRGAAARGRPGRARPRPSGAAGEGFALGQYVNDRPYAASSMLAVAIKEVFRTALTGRCAGHRSWRTRPCRSSCTCPRCPAEAGPTSSRRVFEPLGWRVTATAVPLDPTMPDWGESRYLDVRLAGTVRLADALNHLYVLLPVLDDAKHYWVSTDEVDKLVRAGGDWLARHPEKELITRRYLAHKRELTADALARLAEVDDAGPGGPGQRARGRADGRARSAGAAQPAAPGRRARRRPGGRRDPRRRLRLRRGRAGPRPARRPRDRAGGGHRRLRPGAADRRPQAQAGLDERARRANGSRSSSPRSPTATTGWRASTRPC